MPDRNASSREPRGGRVEPSDPCDFSRKLRLTDERRKNGAENENISLSSNARFVTEEQGPGRIQSDSIRRTAGMERWMAAWVDAWIMQTGSSPLRALLKRKGAFVGPAVRLVHRRIAP